MGSFPLRTRYGKGEELTSHFAADFFDVSFSINALDHTPDLFDARHSTDVDRDKAQALCCFKM